METARRRGNHLKDIRDALIKWRFSIKRRQYTTSPVTAAAIFPDNFISTLASNWIHFVSDLCAVLQKTPWMFLEQHGQEVFDVMRCVDDAVAAAKQEKDEERKQLLESRRQEKQLVREHKRAEREMERERQRTITQKQKEAEKAEKAEKACLCEERCAAKLAAAVATPHPGKKHHGTALEGSSVFNIVSPATPMALASSSEVCLIPFRTS
ncbi:hypothetical protein H0H81_001410 [Sphagnurus paluster]|uniref:Uncharacterized protein n=1 Tax=Sphagnurus paluster TaxID=117069 RepID=A0A9P7FSK5_9AGAR|nr:hypothetical protein H0H81_001410 [Sphagnurus paluster]